MPGTLVLRTGITQARNQFQCSRHWQPMPLGVGRFFRVISGGSVCFWGILIV
jgi:hypothetical protein